MSDPNPNMADPMAVQPKRTQQAQRGPIRERKPAALPELPEPATYEQVLVALANMDPLAQEVMIAQRLASMPSQKDGSMPVNIPRMVRGPWAHQLRKLGIFCIPELATHELVSGETDSTMANHTAAHLQKMTPEEMWNVAKAHNPGIGELVDSAKTPEEKQKAMRILAAKLPVEQRIALEKLSSLTEEHS